jgi:hypothetical protein
VQDSRMPICNDSVQPNLVQIGGFQPQHLVDSGTSDLVRRLPYFRRRMFHPTKTRTDQLLAEPIEQLKGGQMGAARDLDQLRKSISNLRLRQRAQEAEVEKGVLRSMVGS